MITVPRGHGVPTLRKPADLHRVHEVLRDAAQKAGR